MTNKLEMKKYVEIYENMPLVSLAKLINVNVDELKQNIGNDMTIDNIMQTVQLYEFIPICTTNLQLLKLTIEQIMATDIVKPVVSIMGHINHGKSSLVETLTQQNICSNEAGNITQNISLYSFNLPQTEFTLIDTPGHSALNTMRNIIIPLSDIIILVIAANSGPQEETIKIIEQTNHKNRIVCLNKIDSPNVINEYYIYNTCIQHGLSCNYDDIVNQTPVVKISATKKQNIDLLIQEIHNMILKQQFKTDIRRPAIGYIIDAFIQQGKGRIIRILLKAGQCQIGDTFCLSGETYTIGRMWINNILCKKGEMAIAGNYIDIICDAKCNMGDLFFIVNNNKKLQNAICQLQINQITNMSVNENHKFIVYIQTVQQYTLLSSMLPVNSIIKVYLNCNITREDVVYAKSNDIKFIIWYKINGVLQELLTSNEIEYLASPNILIGNIEEFLIIKKKEEEKINIIGTAQIKAIFHMKKDIILGNDVKSGEIILGNNCRIIRNNVLIGTGVIRSLQHERENIEKAKMGIECGIIIKNLKEIEKFEYCVGDIIECIQ